MNGLVSIGTCARSGRMVARFLALASAALLVGGLFSTLAVPVALGDSHRSQSAVSVGRSDPNPIAAVSLYDLSVEPAFSNGTFVVGTDIQPGTYRTRVGSTGCYWERLSGFGGTTGEIIANDYTNATAVVTISPTDKGFSSSGCGMWTTDLSATIAPWSPFSSGTFIVGTDIQAGTYRSPAGSSYCYWERLSGFGGTLGEIIANDYSNAPAVVTISPSDKGFSSSGCGMWTNDLTPATYVALTPTRLLDSRDGYWIGLSGAFSSHVARTFGVAGRGGVPTNATAVTGNLTVTGQTSLGYLYVGPNAMDDPTSSTLNFPLGDDRANAVTVALGAGGTLSVTYVAVPGATAQVIFDVTGYFTPDSTGATYHALTPARVLDSRDGYWIGLSGAFSSHVARTFTVTAHGGVPSNAIAVTGNLTVTGQTALGYLYMGPNAMDDPTSSTLNFPLGDDRANAVTVALGAGGTLSVTYVAVPGASAQVIFDVTGYFTPDSTGATYVALTPARVLDSRDGYWIGLSGASGSHVARTFGVTGHGGVPSNAIAVTGNLTVTGQTALGYLYVGPNATNDPTSSTLNFPLGDDRANAVTVALGAGGTLSVTYVAAPGASAQVIFDVTGYFVK